MARIANVQAFTYENSIGDSEANAGSVRLRKRLASGFSIGGIYTFSKSIDDASSIGAGATTGSGSAGLGAGGTGAAGGGASASAGSGANTVAQNPFDLSVERRLDVCHGASLHAALVERSVRSEWRHKRHAAAGRGGGRSGATVASIDWRVV